MHRLHPAPACHGRWLVRSVLLYALMPWPLAPGTAGSIATGRRPGATPREGLWTVVASPAIGNLCSVALLSSDDGWAVGAGAALLHWAYLPLAR